MDKVVKPTVLETASSAAKLIHIKNNLLPAKKVNVGFGAPSAIAQIPMEKLTPLMKLDFYNDVRKTVEKL